MDELLTEFLTESSENISALDQDMVTLEQNPDNPDLLGRIFRTMHTIKGTCGFIGLPRLEHVAHAGENVLGKIREGAIPVTPAVVTLILECFDRIKMILATLEATQKEPEGDDEELIARLEAAAAGESLATHSSPASGATTGSSDVASEPSSDAPSGDGSHPSASDGIERTKSDHANQEAPAVSLDSQPSTEATPAAPEHAAPAAPAAAPVSATPATPAGDSNDGGLSNKSIRVNVHLLENLMTVVSELVLTRNQLLQMLRQHEDSEFAVPLQRLNHVTSELQDGVMKTRMQPIGNAWSKLPRLVRDLAHDLGKRIDLEMRGEDTELDRQVLELIKDPLTHMVRNSADHGIEMPQDRLAAGKPESGKITLNAYHEGGHIIIEIIDNGRGLNLEKIKKKALTMGLVTESELANMSDAQVRQIIFRAGFSTASQVTHVSGRGVGMDVVRENIQKIGGTIDMESTEGKGTRFMIKIPLTLAIISALIVEAGGERFAVPQISVVELVRAGVHSANAIEMINNVPFLRLRERLLPLVSLAVGLKLRDENSVHEELLHKDNFIVVTQVGSLVYGIIVDQVFETQEIVVKPVSNILRNISVFSGNTILGDGSVVMILDPNGIAGSMGEVNSTSYVDSEENGRSKYRQTSSTSLLIFQAGSNVPKAVPLALVARLEEIEVEQIERSNGQLVVQYRGQLMPLVPIEPTQQLHTKGRQPILVFSDADRFVGLIVDEIIDIVEDNIDIKLRSSYQGSFGSAVICGHATEILDADFFIRQAVPDWFSSGPFTKPDEKKDKARVLLVDDSVFFRNLVVPILKMNGFDVYATETPEEALLLHDEGQVFDIIISDIEFPAMNGFDFARKVRELELWKDKPMLALSSHGSEEDYNRGREAGFDDYVQKSDRDALLHTLEQIYQLSRRTAA
ncbi:MAG: chemotaxis protein CheW [Holosporales bacterium]